MIRVWYFSMLVRKWCVLRDGITEAEALESKRKLKDYSPRICVALERVSNASPLDHLCHGCSHLTFLIDHDHCAWCGSKRTMMMTDRDITPPAHVRSAPVHEAFPDVWEQINFPIQFRLVRGFHIMNGGEV